MSRLLTLALLALALLALAPTLSMAGQASATFQVTATVVASCSVQTQSLALGTYASGGAATPSQGAGGIDVRCTRGTPAQVYLEGTRTLTGPTGNTVAYTLTADGKAWNPGVPLQVVGQGRQAVHVAVQGSVVGGQQVDPGDYTDTEVVRVIY